MSNIIIAPVLPEVLGSALRVSGGYLMAGLSTEEDMTLEAVTDGLVAGTLQLWIVMEDEDVIGAFLTRVVPEGDEKALDVGALGGRNILSWGKAISREMTEFAKFVGARRIIFKGRKALLRAYEGFNIVGEDSPGVYQFERVVA